MSTTSKKTTPHAPPKEPPPAALAPELEALLAQLRAGLTPGAAASTREQAAVVCRLLLAALGAQPGQPMSMPGAPTSDPSARASAPPAAPPAAPPSFVDLVATYAKNNLEIASPPHEHVPYIGAADVMQMMATALGAVGGAR